MRRAAGQWLDWLLIERGNRRNRDEAGRRPGDTGRVGAARARLAGLVAGCAAAAALGGAGTARADGPFDPPAPEKPTTTSPAAAPAPEDEAAEHELRHLLTLSYAYGRGHSMGIGYLRSFVAKKGFFAAYSYGLDARLLTVDYTHLDAALLYATWRLSFRAGALFDLDVGLGGGRSRGEMQGAGRVGLHVRVWWVSVGYDYQFPTTPSPLPRWFSTHELSVRFEIPVMTTKGARYRRPDAPAVDPALPEPLAP